MSFEFALYNALVSIDVPGREGEGHRAPQAGTRASDRVRQARYGPVAVFDDGALGLDAGGSCRTAVCGVEIDLRPLQRPNACESTRRKTFPRKRLWITHEIVDNPRA